MLRPFSAQVSTEPEDFRAFRDGTRSTRVCFALREAHAKLLSCDRGASLFMRGVRLSSAE